MSEKISNIVKNLGIPRLIIIAFFIILCIMAVILKLPLPSLLSDTLTRTGMNGVLVLAMVPAILCGIGLNFGVSLGIVAGLVGGIISIEMNLKGFSAFFVAVGIGIVLGGIIGYFYGLVLNKLKGSEMMVSTYFGFSIISLMCIGWLLLPFDSPELRWPIGVGLRTTISLTDRYAKLLDNFLSFTISGVKVPTGLFLLLAVLCFFTWIFLKSKAGMAMTAAGNSEKFAVASGVNVNKSRIIGTVLSTVLGAIGIIVYSQSYGFIQLYQAPLMMSFAAVAAILIGGASTRTAKIRHVVIGTFLFQGLLTLGLPVANKIVTEGNLSEVLRIIVSNGIILYALTKAKAGEF